jgi:hypothetical protein
MPAALVPAVVVAVAWPRNEVVEDFHEAVEDVVVPVGGVKRPKVRHSQMLLEPG